MASGVPMWWLLLVGLLGAGALAAHILHPEVRRRPGRQPVGADSVTVSVTVSAARTNTRGYGAA